MKALKAWVARDYFGTNHHANGGTASCRSAVFFGLEEEEGRGRTRESGRMGEDFERKKEELEDGQRDFEMMETRLPRGRKQDF